MLNDVEPQRLRADSVKQIKTSLAASKSTPTEPLPISKIRTGPFNGRGSRNTSQSIKAVTDDLDESLGGLSEPEKVELAKRTTADFEDLLSEISKPLSGGRTDAMASTKWLDDDSPSVPVTPKPTAQPLRQSRIDKFDKKEREESSPSIIRTANIGPPPDAAPPVVDSVEMEESVRAPSAIESGEMEELRAALSAVEFREMEATTAAPSVVESIKMQPPRSAPPAVESIEMQPPRSRTPDEFEEALRNLSGSPKKPYYRDSKVDAMASTAWLHDEFQEFDTSSIKSKSTAKANRGRAVWCETQWTNLSFQARKLGMPKLPYYDTKTMLLSKEVNYKMWRQLLKLYDFLGPEKAPLATPIMLEGGEVEWHSFLNEDRGIIADIYDKSLAGNVPIVEPDLERDF